MTTIDDRPIQPLTSELFREAMASFPSGVTIVTTIDAAGAHWGFTANSFCSVSADPPLVLVCLAKTAQCHPAFLDAARWVIHFIHDQHAELAGRFATRGADKFAGGEFGASSHGVPVLPDAPARLECSTYARYDGGDHTILIGQVRHIELGTDHPAIYYRRNFYRLPVGEHRTGRAQPIPKTQTTTPGR